MTTRPWNRTHLEADQPAYDWIPPNPTACTTIWWNPTPPNTTTNPTEVTCRNCLALIAKRP